MEIIVDDREKAVTPFLETYSEKFSLKYTVKRLTIGDYAIAYNGKILVIFERKTWADLAASLRDGRKENVKKLLNLRAELPIIKICYIMEGRVSRDSLVARMPVKNLRSHLDHLIFRDQIHILYTKDQDDTAFTLFELAQNYFTIKPSILPLDGEENVDQTVKLSEKQESEISIEEQLLKCVPNVGYKISTVLAENGITIKGLMLKQYTPEHLARFKLPLNTSIGLERATKIVNCHKLFSSNSVQAVKFREKLLETIPLVSSKVSKMLLSACSLTDIVNGIVTEEQIAAINKTEKTKIGKKCANNIVKYLVTA